MPFSVKHMLFVCIILSTIVEEIPTNIININLASIMLVLTPQKQYQGDGEETTVVAVPCT